MMQSPVLDRYRVLVQALEYCTIVDYYYDQHFDTSLVRYPTVHLIEVYCPVVHNWGMVGSSWR